jgi:hypothetical protein
VKKAQVTSNAEINTLDKNIDIIKKWNKVNLHCFNLLPGS